jgi:hypothetical protein
MVVDSCLTIVLYQSAFCEARLALAEEKVESEESDLLLLYVSYVGIIRTFYGTGNLV